MRWLALALIPAAWLAAVFQTTVAPAMTVRQVSPDALALLAGLWLSAGPLERRSVWVAAALGFASDLISPGPLGVGMFAYFLAAHGVLAVRGKLSADSIALRLLLTAGFATAAALVIAMLYTLSGDAGLSAATLIARVIGVGLYTAALGLPLAMILSWLPTPALSPGS
jgi:rod shape-determining protein MreD